jgi:transcriptional regulator NrdR family protein
MKEGLKCTKCGETKHKVQDSRKNGKGIKRRRVCLSCGTMQNTFEFREVDYKNLETYFKNKTRGMVQNALNQVINNLS